MLDHLQRGALDKKVQFGVIIWHSLAGSIVLASDDNRRTCNVTLLCYGRAILFPQTEEHSGVQVQRFRARCEASQQCGRMKSSRLQALRLSSLALCTPATIHTFIF